MTTEPTLAAKVCDHRPMPGGSTLREVLTAANLHAEDMIAEILKAGMELAQAHPPLWCLHIIGPDDVYPAPSKEHAEMAVAAYTAILAQDSERTGIRIECVAAPWPHSAESHAKGVGSFITDHLIPAWQQEAHTTEAPNTLMQMIQKASFSSTEEKEAALAMASVMVPVPARPAVNCIDLPAGWKITRDGDRLCVKRPDGVTSEWNGRPETNGTGMYDLCMDLIAGAREIPGMDLRPVRSLIACAEELMERTEQPPKANCTCHLAPPCGDCTDWGGLRETRANLQEAIDAAEAAFPGVANG